MNINKKIKNQSTNALMAYQQMLEHTNSTLDSMATKMDEDTKNGLLDLSYYNSRLKVFESKFHKNNELIEVIDSELNERITNVFPSATTPEFLKKEAKKWEIERNRYAKELESKEMKSSEEKNEKPKKAVIKLKTSNEKEV